MACPHSKGLHHFLYATLCMYGGTKYWRWQRHKNVISRCIHTSVMPGIAGLEPTILDWYGHCGGKKLVGSGGHAPQGKFLKLGTLRSLLRSFLGQNATRITPPVVFVARETVETRCQNKKTSTHDGSCSTILVAQV